MDAMAAESEASRTPARGVSDGRAGARAKPITVLIVDDERTFGEALELALAREKDFRIVDVATDATQAIQAASQHQPDVVLMDVAMPGMNGIEATRRIKQADPDAAVLIL
jgi:DNA-binding NarL/FixJ family response regulator